MTKIEASLIGQIVHRFRQDNPAIDSMSLFMDIENAHKDTPLGLASLVNAPNEDFYHDVIGINQNINRTTGKLENFFVPRYAKGNGWE